MRAKIVLCLLSTFGVTTLVVSALAQGPVYTTLPNQGLTKPAEAPPTIERAPGSPTVQGNKESLPPPPPVRAPDHLGRFPGSPDGGPGTFNREPSLPQSEPSGSYLDGRLAFTGVPDGYNSLVASAAQKARQLAEAKSDSERDGIRADLVKLLEEQFDLRQRRQEEEIQALETRVRNLRDLVRRRKEGRSDIVAKRLEQLVSDAHGLGW